MQNADGTADCDRCGITLLGYGVIYGMVCTDLDGAHDYIVCYICRPIVLDGLMNYSGNPNQCNHCGELFAIRSVSLGLLVTDLAPAITPPTPRALLFCEVRGSRGIFLSRLVI